MCCYDAEILNDLQFINFYTEALWGILLHALIHLVAEITQLDLPSWCHPVLVMFIIWRWRARGTGVITRPPRMVRLLNCWITDRSGIGRQGNVPTCRTYRPFTREREDFITAFSRFVWWSSGTCRSVLIWNATEPFIARVLSCWICAGLLSWQWGSLLCALLVHRTMLILFFFPQGLPSTYNETYWNDDHGPAGDTAAELIPVLNDKTHATQWKGHQLPCHGST